MTESRLTALRSPSISHSTLRVASEQDDLAEVVAVVVGGEEDFAQEALAVSPGDGGVEVLGRIHDHLFEFSEIGVERSDGLVPGLV